MALVFKDRVKVTSTTAGTGTFTLGSAVTGFQSFSVIGNGNTTYYTITDESGNWEVGIGTYTSSGTTLSRDTILESSNSGSVVDFPSGTKTVFVTYPAEKSVGLDASDELTTVVSIAKGGTGQTSAANAINALLPTQTGNDGKFLKTNGSAVSWDTPSGGSSAKTWTAFTASGTYTVPAGVSSIRAYAFGKGGNGAAAAASTRPGGGGGGGGCAFGDIAVTAGQSVTVTISAGVATVTYNSTTMLTANPGSNGSAATGGAGGSASKDASVTNGGAYTGGSGGSVSSITQSGGGGGGSAGSPLGNGYAGGINATSNASGGGGGGGAGGKGGNGTTASGSGGGGGGAGGAGGDGIGAGGGAGGAASGSDFGTNRSQFSAFSDPIMAHCVSAGGGTIEMSSQPYATSGPFAGGGGGAGLKGGSGGDFGGGAAGYGDASGAGGFGGGGGGAGLITGCSGGNGGYGGGGGGGGLNTTQVRAAGTGGAAIVLIYA